MKSRENQYALMERYLRSALSNVEKRLIFNAFQDVLKFLKVYFRYLDFLKLINNKENIK